MGPIGMPEIFVLFVVFLLLAAIIVAVVLVKSRKSPSTSFSRSNSAQDRLSEIDSLLQKKLITEAEYEAKRKAIVDSL